MNGMDTFGINRGFNNTSNLVDKAKASDLTSQSHSSMSESTTEDSTVNISREALLLNQSSEATKTTSKGNLLPEYLQPPTAGLKKNIG